MPAKRLDRPSLLLLLGFIFVGVAAAVTVWLHHSQQRADNWVRHTLVVQARLSRVEARLLQAESAQRGYFLTDSARFLETYRRATRELPAAVTALMLETRDNPRQQHLLNRLQSQIAERTRRLERGTTAHAAGIHPTVDQFEIGRSLTSEISRLIQRIRTEENRLLFLRRAESDRLSWMVSAGLFGSAATAILLGLFAILNLRRRLRASEADRRALDEANRRLVEEADRTAAAEGMVRQMQKMESIGQLAGGIAHDFNNMLAVILGSLDLVRRRMGDAVDARIQRGIDNATDGAERAAQLTKRLLAFSRRQPLEPQPIDVNKLVSGMSDMLRRTIGEQIQVETVLSGGLWRTLIDPTQLESAILNLCVNGRDAIWQTGRTGRLTIDTANTHLDEAYAVAHHEVATGQYVMVSVTDSGVGMPAEVIERAFDPFYTTKQVGRGTGLGLSQVYGFVKQSGGHVKIYSEQGQGTTVKLYLPRHYGEDREAPAAPADAAPPRARAGELILVVEDEAAVRQVSVDALEELGYRVIEAADAERALTVLAGPQGLSIDLLFTDVVMPGLNGRQLADRAQIDRPDLKILYTTGYTRNAIVHNGMLDPGVQFLAKPYTFEQLAMKIRQVLDAPLPDVG